MNDTGDWIRWAPTALVALGGLVLGIRAEIRNVRFKAKWTVQIEGDEITVVNRTGEDATNVSISVPGAHNHAEIPSWRIIKDGEMVAKPLPRQTTEQGSVRIQWVRPSRNTMYFFDNNDPDDRSRVNRWRDARAAGLRRGPRGYRWRNRV